MSSVSTNNCVLLNTRILPFQNLPCGGRRQERRPRQMMPSAPPLLHTQTSCCACGERIYSQHLQTDGIHNRTTAHDRVANTGHALWWCVRCSTSPKRYLTSAWLKSTCKRSSKTPPQTFKMDFFRDFGVGFLLKNKIIRFHISIQMWTLNLYWYELVKTFSATIYNSGFPRNRVHDLFRFRWGDENLFINQFPAGNYDCEANFESEFWKVKVNKDKNEELAFGATANSAPPARYGFDDIPGEVIPKKKAKEERGK